MGRSRFEPVTFRFPNLPEQMLYSFGHPNWLLLPLKQTVLTKVMSANLTHLVYLTSPTSSAFPSVFLPFIPVPFSPSLPSTFPHVHRKIYLQSAISRPYIVFSPVDLVKPL